MEFEKNGSGPVEHQRSGSQVLTSEQLTQSQQISQSGESSGLKAEDLIPPPKEEFEKERLDKERRLREQASLEEQIYRVEKLLDNDYEPAAHALGLRLALEMAKEIRDQKPLGHESGELILKWRKDFSDHRIDQAIAHARVLLTQPAQLAAELKQRLFGGRS